MAGRGRPKNIVAKTTELDVREGNLPNPNQLAENRPEERPFNDRTDIEAAYAQYREQSDKDVSEIIFSQSQGDVEENPDEAEEKPTVQDSEPVKEKTAEEPQTEPTGETGVTAKEPLVPESTGPQTARFKDVREAEEEVTKLDERYKNAEKKMHEATQEAAELKRQLKYMVDTLQQGNTPKKEEPPVKQVKRSVLDLPDEELSTAILERPKEILEELRKEAKEEAVKETIGIIEERVKQGTQQQSANMLKEKLTEADRYFDEHYTDMKPFEKLISTLATHALMTPDGYQMLLKDPKAYIDSTVEASKNLLGIASNKNQPAPTNGSNQPTETTKTESQPVVQGEKREKLIASPVVRPVSGAPTVSQEDKPMTPQDYIDQRRKIQDRSYIGRDL